MKRDFDADARTWDQDEDRLRMALAVADAMAAELQLSGCETLLDYGTGTGVVGLRLAPMVKAVLCADASRGMLEVLDTKIRSSHLLNVRSVRLDLDQGTDLAAAIPPTDVLVSSMALHHIADTAALLRKFFSLVNPGGRIALADLDTEAGDFHADNTGVEHFGFDRANLERLVREAGFKSVATRTAHTMTRTTVAGAQKEFSIFVLTGRRA